MLKLRLMFCLPVKVHFVPRLKVTKSKKEKHLRRQLQKNEDLPSELESQERKKLAKMILQLRINTSPFF